MPSTETLLLFIPTFFMVSVTPGMCMTLALTLGMRFGLRKTGWMMCGELAGVGLVVVASAIGVASVMLSYPILFWVLKYAGGSYLIYLGVQMWRSRGKMSLKTESSEPLYFSRTQLATQGFTTAIANPKGWAFFIALLPPFLDPNRSLAAQLSILTLIIVFLEATCLCFYASGGKTLGRLLGEEKHQHTLNRVSGGLLSAVGIWLMLGK